MTAPSASGPGRAVAGPTAAALAAFGLHLACGGRYGIFRDELYFLVCGERLSAGYVDQPPGIALVARLAHGVFGTWVPGLRLLPWLAAAATVLVAGRLALRLGGGAPAALLAAIAAASCPLLAGLGHYLTMNAFEPLVASALALVLLRLAGGGDPRLWLAAGALAAAGVLFKYTAAILALSLLAGLAASPARRALRTPWALGGAALAVALVLPNLLWQARHGFPFLELVRRGREVKNVALSPGAFVAELLLTSGPLVAVVWAGGLAWLLSARRAAPARFLGTGAALYLSTLVVSGGKPYYAAPVLPILVAAGGVALSALVRTRPARIAASAAVAGSGLALAPLAVPLLPPEALVAYEATVGVRARALERKAEGALPQVFADQFGWEALAQAVSEVYRALPAAERERAAIYAQNYGEAAAIDVLGDRDLPPAASGHNQYFLWGPPPGRGDPLLVVGGDEEDCGGGAWRSRTVARRLPGSPWAMPYERHRTLWICRDLAGSIERLWPATRHYE